MVYDVLIIGAGIVGCAVARALSRYDLRVLVAERLSDAACGASKANSGIVHAGYDCEPGTRKAALNVRGVELYKTLVEELDIPYRNNGSMVLCLEDSDMPRLRELYERGLRNNVPGLSMLTSDEALNREPHINPQVKAALLAETAGVISPYEAAIAFAENAAVNGVEFLFNTSVTGITRNNKDNNTHYTINTSQGTFTTKTIINAAGVYSGDINNYICEEKEQIHLQRGQYYLLDNTQRGLVSHTIFQLPTPLGKGVLVVPTVDYNILLGPNAETLDDPTDTQTTIEGLREVLEKTVYTLPSIPINDRITAFAGIRAKRAVPAPEDFLINEPLPGFINAIGIDSPGLSAAPAIAEEIAGMVAAFLQPGVKTDFTARRLGIKRFRELPYEEQSALIRENPAYGHIVCRCETITEGEIQDAIRWPIGARSLDALKRRTRAQMGRCQGGFCTVGLIEILSREMGIPETDVVRNEPGSQIMFKTARE